MLAVRTLAPLQDVEQVREVVATLVMTRGRAKQLLARTNLFWKAFKLGHGTCQLARIDYAPLFFEDRLCGESYKDVTPGEAEALETMFADDSPCGFKDAPSGLPERGNLPHRNCKLFIRDAASPDREEGMVDYFWVTTRTGTGVDLRTATLQQEDIMELISRMAGR